MKSFDYIEVQQPIGTFYLCCIPASILTKIVRVSARSKDDDGVQRDMSKSRIKSIGIYCSDPDAIFPTPIVVSVDKSAHVILDENNHKISFSENSCIGDVIDGQHRLWGIEHSSYIDNFNLPVVLMFDLTIEEKAYIFSTINSNQTKVPPSLIYDLFDVSNLRSPNKTVHHIARVLNYSKESPFYNRLKMLGKKESNQDKATLSQGTFAKSILMLLSKDPDKDAILIKNGKELNPNDKLIFRQYFIDNKDEIIIKILLNCFNALKEVFYEEWDDPQNNILWKTTGFRAIIYALPSLCNKGIRNKMLTQDFFKSCFSIFKTYLNHHSLSLTSDDFPGGGEQNQKKLAKIIVESIADNDITQYKAHLVKAKNIQDFIDNIIDINKYELYDLAKALDNYTAASYGTLQIKDKDNVISIVYPNTDISIEVPKERSREYLEYIENKYMSGMGYESWLSYNESLEKDY